MMDWVILVRLQNHFQKKFDKIIFLNKINYIKLFAISKLVFYTLSTLPQAVRKWQPTRTVTS